MRYRAEIDGLRAVAVIPVILFHAGFDVFSGGYVGVDVFFVISGYLITSIILDDLEAGKFNLIGFYERRARRILPALFFIMLICIPFAWMWLMPKDLAEFEKSIFAVSTFSSNFLFWQESDYFDTAAELKPLLHTWSLAVEEQYYILFPLFLILTWRFGKPLVLTSLFIVFVISLGAAEWAAYRQPATAFYLLHTRGWELLLGVFCAFYLNRFTPSLSPVISQFGSLTGLALILLAVFAYDASTPFPGLYALVPTVGTVLIILFAVAGTAVNALLGHRSLVFFGLLSYSAYLWHQPLIAFARHRSLTEPSDWMIGGLCIATFPLAYLSWRYVEKPFRHRGNLTRRAIFVLSITGITLFSAIGLSGYISQWSGDRHDEVFRILSVKDGWEDKDPCAFSGPVEITEIKRCSDSDSVVYLIGDSHAAAISKALRDELTKLQIRLISWTENACLPIPDTSREPLSVYRNCAEYKQQVFDYLSDNPAPTVIVTRWRFNIVGDRFNNGEGGVEHGPIGLNVVTAGDSMPLDQHIEQNLNKLAESAPLIVVNQIPEAGWDVPNTMAKMILFGQDSEKRTTSYDTYVDQNRRVNRIMNDLSDSIGIVFANRLICSDESRRCKNSVEGVPLYWDGHHPSLIYSMLISREIVKFLVPPSE